MRVLLVSGPNLSQLGSRDPSVYGTTTLDGLVEVTRAVARTLGADLEHVVSESEAELVTRLHAARTDGTAAVIINAGALTHYSIALRDALELLAVPKVEVHLSNVHAREPFRQRSVLAGVVDGTIAGFGPVGYELAVRAVVSRLAGDGEGAPGPS